MIYVNSEDPLAGLPDAMTTTVTHSDETTGSEEDASGPMTEAQISLMSFWPTITDEIKRIKSVDAKNQVLPLARIKKIMKLDEDVKMISAEAPLLFAKAAEIFIHELTLRAWVHTEDNKRRTLQRNDIAMAITKYDQFDFLIDIVPRDEVRPVKKEPVTKTVVNSDQVQYYLQLAQQHAMQGGTTQLAQTAQQQQPQQQQQVTQIQQPTPQQIQLPAGTIQMQAPSMAGPITLGSPPNILLTNSLGIQQPQQQQQQIQLLQQIVTPNGEITHIQIPQNQLNLIRMQQQLQQQQQQHPIIIQTSPMHGQQILQMNHQQQQQAPNVFITQAGPDDQ